MKRCMHLTAFGLIVGFIGVMAGCAHQQKPAAAMPAHDQFETVKDPPISAKTYFAAGQLAESQGRLPQAAQEYNQVLFLHPKDQGAMFRLGVVLATMKDYTRAIQVWNQYIQLTGGDATAYSNLGFCQELAWQSDAAELSYKRGIAKDPRNEPCHVNYGLMLARKGRTEAALLQLQTVLTPAEAHYDLGSIYETQHRKQDALAEYRKAMQLDPQFDEAKARIAGIGM